MKLATTPIEYAVNVSTTIDYIKTLKNPAKRIFNGDKDKLDELKSRLTLETFSNEVYNLVQEHKESLNETNSLPAFRPISDLVRLAENEKDFMGSIITDTAYMFKIRKLVEFKRKDLLPERIKSIQFITNDLYAYGFKKILDACGDFQLNIYQNIENDYRTNKTDWEPLF